MKFYAETQYMKAGAKPTGLTVLRDKLRHTRLIHYYRNVRSRVMRRSDGEAILLRRYARIHGKPLNLTDPRTYTEKLFWRMITWNRGDMPLRFTQLTDKYAARAHVARTVGAQHLVKLLWHGDDPRAIPFDRLPTEYVIKPNHAAGQVITVTGQADRRPGCRPTEFSRWPLAISCGMSILGSRQDRRLLD